MPDIELYPQPNLDVARMQYDLDNQARMFTQSYASPSYDNSQAVMTGNRASYGDIPAMLMSGVQATGSAFAGAAQGAGAILSGAASMISPVRYMAPAQVHTGYYGQYAQDTGFMRSSAAALGIGGIPRGANAYQYGVYAAEDVGGRIAGGGFAVGSVLTGLAAGSMAGTLGTVAGGIIGSPLGPAGMAAGAFIGNMAANVAGYLGVDALSERVVQRREIGSFLSNSSFRFVGAGNPMADPRFGGSMNRDARREATEFMSKMDVKDPGMNMEDLTAVLKGATNLGMFTGTKDIDDFKRKFKDIVEGVKVISKTLNSTLDEGLQFMKDFKSIGVDASQMASKGFQASALGKASGRTAQEVVGMGLQGAELFRGTGVSMDIGYQASVMNMAAIRSARDAGLISQEAVSQAGGEEAMAQRMTAGSLQFMQSAVGRGYASSFFNPSASPAGFDANAFRQQVMSGTGSLVGMAERGALNLGSPEAIVKFTVNQDKIMSELGKTFGGRGAQLSELDTASKSAKFYQEQMNVDYMTAMKFSLMTDQGKTAQQADDLLKIMQNAPKEFADKMKGYRATEIQQSVDEAYRVGGLQYKWESMKDTVSMYVEPYVKGGYRAIDAGEKFMSRVYEEDVKGITRYDVSNIDMGSAVFSAPVGPKTVESYRGAGEPELSRFEGVDTKKSTTDGGKVQGMMVDYAKKIRKGVDEGKLTGKMGMKELVGYVTDGKKGIGDIDKDEYAAIVEGTKLLEKSARKEVGAVNLTDTVSSLVTDTNYLRYGGRMTATKNFSSAASMDLAGLVTNIDVDTGIKSGAADTFVKVGGGEAVDLTKGGMFGLGKSAGEQIRESMVAIGKEDVVKKKKGAEAGDIIVDREGDDVYTVSRKDYEDTLKSRRGAFMTFEEAKKIREEKQEVVATGRFTSGELAQGLGDKATLEQVVREAYNGKKIDELTTGERANLVLESQNSSVLEKLLKQEKIDVGMLESHGEASGVKVLADLTKRTTEIGEKVAEEMGLTVWGGSAYTIPGKSLEKLYQAKQEKDPEKKKELVAAALKVYTDDKEAGLPSMQYAAAKTQFEAVAGLGGKVSAAAQSYVEDYGIVREQATKEVVKAGAEKMIYQADVDIKSHRFDPDDKANEARKSEVSSYVRRLYTGEDKVAAYAELDVTKGVGKDISALSLGPTIEATSKAVKDILAADKSMKGAIPSQKEISALDAKLQTSILDPDVRKKTVETFATSGGKAAAEGIANLATLVPGMETGAHGPAAARTASPEASGTAQGTAAEITAQQMNINLEILEALKALNAGRGR